MLKLVLQTVFVSKTVPKTYLNNLYKKHIRKQLLSKCGGTHAQTSYISICISTQPIRITLLLLHSIAELKHGFECNLEKNTYEWVFPRLSKLHESEERVLLEVYEKLTSACFSKLHEKPCYYLVIIYMTKLCRIEAYVYVTQNNLFTSDCQYFYNEKTFVRMTEIKQCVLNTKKC